MSLPIWSNDPSQRDDNSDSSRFPPPERSDTPISVAESEASTTETLKPEDEDFTRRSIARHKRRLEERWACQVADHAHCFANRDGAHVPMSEQDIGIWAKAIHNGEATLLVPPKQVWVPSFSESGSDTSSIKSNSSWKTITYQRPPKKQSDLTLTDLRSRRVRETLTSDTSSTFSAKTAVPNLRIGYMFQTAVNWGKTRLQDHADAPEIQRRRNIISSTLLQFEKTSKDERLGWITEHQVSLNRVIDDLLELSMDYYRSEYRSTAVAQAIKIDELISEVPFLPHDPGNSWYLIRFKLQPLVSLHLDVNGVHVAHDMRETLLQEASDTSDTEQMAQEIALQLCHELAYGPATGSWRYNAFFMLWIFHSTEVGRSRLQEIGKNGKLMNDLAMRVFDRAIEDWTEHANAICFFGQYAQDMPFFQPATAKPAGLPLLVSRIRDATVDQFILRVMIHVLASVSGRAWAVDILEPLVICPLVVNVIMCYLHTPDSFTKASTIYHLVTVLRNVSLYGGEAGAMEARKAMSGYNLPQSEVPWETLNSLISAQMGSIASKRFDEIKREIDGDLRHH